MTSFPGWALPAVCCPHCAGLLRSTGEATVACSAGHSFDVARHGYLPLLGANARTDTADDARMVAARATFLGGGWYRPLAEAVAAARVDTPGARRPAAAALVDTPGARRPAAAAPPGPVVEVGAGTGYYLAAVLEAAGPVRRGTGSTAAHAARDGPVPDPPRGLALDSSKYALRRAARHPQIAAVLADAWSPLPVRDGVAAAVLSVFAPRNPAELARIAAPGGRIVVVSPEPDHLAELRAPLGLLAVDAGKADRVADAFASQAPGMTEPVASSRLGYRCELPHDAVRAVVAMGPTARHIAEPDLAAAVARLDEPVRVTVSVSVVCLRRTGWGHTDWGRTDWGRTGRAAR